MTEDPQIIRLNIRHYQELLKLDRHTVETRQRVSELLAEAQRQLLVVNAPGPESKSSNPLAC